MIKRLRVTKRTQETYHRSDKINENEEPHRKTAEPNQLGKDHQLAKIMDSRVNPSTPLREQNTPRFRSHRMRDRIWAELGLERREMLHQQRRQEPILSEQEEILLVKRIDVGLRVFLDDVIGDNDWSTFVCSPNAIQRETTRQTGDGTEERFKSLGKMMRDIVFVDLDHRQPRTFFVCQLGFATNTDNPGIVGRDCNQSVDRIRSNSLKGCQHKLVSCTERETYHISIHRIDANNIPHLMVNLQLQR